MKKIFYFFMALLIGFLQPFRTNGQCVFKINTTSTANQRPQISGNTIVWEGTSGGTSHIYKFDGTTVMQVSTTSTNNRDPQISGNTIVWEGTSGGTSHIFKFDGTTVMQVSSNVGPTASTSNRAPQIDGNTIVWHGFLGGDIHIFKFDGTEVMQVSSNVGTTPSTTNILPQISGNTIVWLGTSGSQSGHVFKFDGTSVIRVTAVGFNNNVNLRIDGNTIVWNNNFQVFKFDGTSVTQVSTGSTGSAQNYFPQISGNTIVWYSSVGSDYPVVKSDGITVTQVSNSASSSNGSPQIDGNTIVWEGTDNVSGVRHIFKSDGTTVTQVSNSGTNNRNPQVSGNTVVWYGNDGTTNQIYYQSCTPTCTPVATATETMTWTGTVSTDWNNACNWSPNGVPTATNPVLIPATTNDPIISSGTRVAKNIEITGSGAILTVNAGATLTLSAEGGAMLVSNSGQLTNRGTINATNTTPTTNSTVALELAVNVTVDNYGTLNLTASQNNGIEIGTNSTFRNYSGGNIVINARGGIRGGTGTIINDAGATMTVAGSNFGIQTNGTVSNSGMIDVIGTMECNSGTQIINNVCGIIKLTGDYFNSNQTTTNNGFISIGGTLHNSSGTFTNSGVLKYGNLRLNSSLLNTGDAAVVVNNALTPIFTYGGTYNGTINGIFTNAATTTSAGTFTAPNTFVPLGSLTTGQTLYAKITPQGGACSYVVPFVYARSFVSTWKLDAGTTTLSVSPETVGEVAYVWTTVPAGTSGSGVFNQAYSDIAGIPAGATIELSISPTNFRRININNGLNKSRLLEIKQWGDVPWTTMENAFNGCNNLEVTATDNPNLSAVTNMANMFRSATKFNQDISDWNIAGVTNMSDMFNGATAFNQSLAAWGTKFNANVILTGFLNNCGMNIANYAATLTGFNAGTVTGRSMGATNLKYCASAADRANLINVKSWIITGDASAAPTAPTGTSNSSICNNGTASLSAICVTETVKWYGSNSTSLLFTGSPYLTPNLTANTTYNVRCESSSCNSAFVPVAVTMSASTTPTVSISPTLICEGTSTTLTATATNGGSSPQFYWTKNNEPQGISDFINKTTTDGLGANGVSDVYVDKNGTIYAATFGGLSISTNGGTSFTNKTTAEGLGSNGVTDVYVDNGGTIYAATFGGLSISSNGGTSFINKTTTNGLGANLVQGVYVNNAGVIYAATNGGLSILTDGGTSFTNKTTANGLGDNGVQDVFVDNAGTIYAATSGPNGGVSISSDGGMGFINKNNGLLNNKVSGFHVGTDGTIYAGVFASTSAGSLSIAHQATGNSLAVTSAVAGDVYKVRLVPSADACSNPATAMASVTINATPSAPTGTSNSSICNNTKASLSAICATGTVKWYDSNSTTLLFTGSPFVTLNLTTATTYNVRCEDVSCNSVFVPVSVNITPTVTATENMTWTGTVSTDWNNACNWTPNGVPTATNAVIIPDVANDPIVPTSLAAVAKNITFPAGNPNLAVQSNATLTVTGTVVNLQSATITNAGTISTAGFRSENNAPPVHTLTFLNESTGVVNGSFFTTGGSGGSFGAIHLTNHGNINYSGSDRAIYLSHYTSTFNNYGTINVTGGLGIHLSVNNYVNHPCGKILVSAGVFQLDDYDFQDFINHGLVQVAGKLAIENDKFANYGVVKYGTLEGIVKNVEGIIVNDALPIFTYGSSSLDVVNGIFTDAAATTPAGTFTAPNTFVPSGLPAGSQTLYAKITPSGGACSYVVPFTYFNTTCTLVATATQNITWTGTVSTDWNNACNWSPNGVPTATNPVTIPNVANDPVVLSGGAAVAQSMTFQEGAHLTVQSGATLTVTNEVIITVNATITNSGTVTAEFAVNAPSSFIFIKLTFVNESTGIVNGNFSTSNYQTSNIELTNRGTINYSGSAFAINITYHSVLNNYGIINITGGRGVVMDNSTSGFTNHACGKILMSAGTLGLSFSSGTRTNFGLIQVAGEITEVKNLINKGVIKYGTLIGDLFDNSSGVIVNDTPTPIFTYGGTYNGTVNGIFTDAAATTSAGSFTAPNTFVPSGLPAGSQTLYAKITPSGGACSYVVPFTYNNVAKKLFVKADAAGANNGASWTDAFTNLQSALAIAITGDEIWVAKGTYKPTANASGNTNPTDPRTKTFVMKQGVKIYGSFAGTEANLSERTLAVVAANPAILSGDFNGDDVVNGSGSSLSITGNAENSYTVINNSYSVGNPLTPTAVLDGFTITGGNFNSTSYSNGGGMHNQYASPSLSNVIFTGNSAKNGGGMQNYASSLSLNNVAFTRNQALFGGGVYSQDASNAILTNVSFTGNKANVGGGLDNRNSSPNLNKVSFISNYSSGDGGGMTNQGGAAVLTNVIFSENTAGGEGGGLYDIQTTATLSNVVFSKNTAIDDGGGMSMYGSTPTLINVTFSENSTSNQGGGLYAKGSATSIKNSIFWGNTKSGSATVQGADIESGFTPSPNTTITVTNTLLQVENTATNYPITGNEKFVFPTGHGNLFAQNPLFVNAADPDGADDTFRTADDGLMLSVCSPAINAGNNADIPSGITTDIVGNPRTFNTKVDMGAYEMQAASTPIPTITLGTIPTTILAGATTFNIPYTATGTPTTYSISGTGFTTLTDAALPSSPITVNLSPAASINIDFTLTVKNANGCTSTATIGSVIVNISLTEACATATFTGTAPIAPTATTAGVGGRGGIHTYTVPTGVTAIRLDAKGAKGGRTPEYEGGQGGRVQATYAVTPGDVLYILVGGKGGDAASDGNVIIDPMTGATEHKSAAGGGGATVVSKGPIGSGTLLLVAGGGGGAGDQGVGGVSGNFPGSGAGARGAGGASFSANGGNTINIDNCGQGGQALNAGGNGGANTCFRPKTNGGGYGGGGAGNYNPPNNTAGGGGGGGYIGGNAGALAGGNGGSSYTDASASDVTTTNHSDDNGSVAITVAATISYTGSPFCKSLTATSAPKTTGYTGGIFSAIPTGLTIDATTGVINPSTSTDGNYTIFYNIAGSSGCSNLATTTVKIINIPTASINYSEMPFCKNLTNGMVTIIGTSGGIFSSTAGLSINAITGTVNPSTSSAGSYAVTYTIGPSDGCGEVISKTSVIINNVPEITHQPQNVSICQGNNTTFSVQSNQTDLSHKWEVNMGSGFMPIEANTVYSGQNSLNLSLNFPSVNYNNYKYRCKVSQKGCSTLSKVATLSMSGSAEALNIVNVSPISGVYSQTAVAYTIALNKLEPNANVLFKSGNAIELLPGFETRTGAVFATKIESPCGLNTINNTFFENLPKEIRK